MKTTHVQILIIIIITTVVSNYQRDYVELEYYTLSPRFAIDESWIRIQRYYIYTYVTYIISLNLHDSGFIRDRSCHRARPAWQLGLTPKNNISPFIDNRGWWTRTQTPLSFVTLLVIYSCAMDEKVWAMC